MREGYTIQKKTNGSWETIVDGLDYAQALSEWEFLTKQFPNVSLILDRVFINVETVRKQNA